jgi:hypothetical protein
MKTAINKRKRKTMRQLLFYVLLIFLPFACSAQPPDTLQQEVRVVHLDTTDVRVSNPFILKNQRVKMVDESKKLLVVWKKKQPFIPVKVFRKNGLLFSADFFWSLQEDSTRFVLDMATGKKVYLGSDRWKTIYKEDSIPYICYPKVKKGHIIADFKTNEIIREVSEVPPRKSYIFFPEDVMLYRENIKGKGRMNPYRIIHAYSIEKDSVLWSKDEVHSKLIDIVDGEGKYEYLGEYKYVKDWRVTEDYLIIDGKFPSSPRRLYFFDKYSFTIKKAYPYPGKYYYKFKGDTLYWFIKSKGKINRMYAVDYRNDRIHYGLKRKTSQLNFKGDYIVFNDRDPSVYFVDRKTGEPLKRIKTTKEFNLTSFDYINGNIISTVSSKDYMPRMSKDIEGYHDVLIDISTLKQYKLEELSNNLCEECIQPEYPVDCVNKLRYLDITYKDYIYAALECGDYYYLLCLKVEDKE